MSPSGNNPPSPLLGPLQMQNTAHHRPKDLRGSPGGSRFQRLGSSCWQIMWQIRRMAEEKKGSWISELDDPDSIYLQARLKL